jgi:hypothetical protein
MPGVNIDLPCAAYTGDEPFAFISYAHFDAETVYPEIQRLDLMGYRVWYDEGIDPGNEWPEEVAGALKRSTQFIVFVTQRAIGSRNVRNEINYALKHDKPFFAIHLAETELPPGMDLQMSSIQAIFKWRMNDQTYVRNLERALPRNFGQPEESPKPEGKTNYDQLVDLFARTMHIEQQSRMRGTDPVNWHQLESAVKQQLVTQSQLLLSMLHVAGFNVDRAQDTDAPLVFGNDTLDLLARMEHDRWCRERIDNGWRHGPKRDNEKQIHPMLVPWPSMPAEMKQYDREAVCHLPELLLKSGYAISSIYEYPERKTLFQFANNRMDSDGK